VYGEAERMTDFEGRTVPARILGDVLAYFDGAYPTPREAWDVIDRARAALAASQPAPEVQAGAVVAEVLEGLVEGMSGLARRALGTGIHGAYYREGVFAARALVERLAATGARAAGGETEALDRAARKMDVMRERVQAVIDAYAAAPPAPVAPGVAEHESDDGGSEG
jgi:hypothetical protein